jgi:CheY-like chemotaxis protein
MEDVKILNVEDNMIIAAKTSLHLSNLGYAVTGIVTRGEEALRSLAEDRPDIVLLDIDPKVPSTTRIHPPI